MSVSIVDRYQALPARLQRAIWLWLGLAALTALLPRASLEAVGVLAHPAFWCGLLPLLALAPHFKQLLPPRATRVQRPRRTISRVQARRRTRAGRTDRAAA